MSEETKPEPKKESGMTLKERRIFSRQFWVGGSIGVLISIWGGSWASHVLPDYMQVAGFITCVGIIFLSMFAFICGMDYSDDSKWTDFPEKKD